jgi:hypothetical protein
VSVAYFLYAFGPDGRLVGPAMRVPASDDQAAVAKAAEVRGTLGAILMRDARIIREFPSRDGNGQRNRIIRTKRAEDDQPDDGAELIDELGPGERSGAPRSARRVCAPGKSLPYAACKSSHKKSPTIQRGRTRDNGTGGGA